MKSNYPESRIRGLARQKALWRHVPTKAVRVPEVFENQVLDFARVLDTGEQSQQKQIVAQRAAHQTNTATTLEALLPQLRTWELEDLLKLQLELPVIIQEKRESQCDRRLERAIVYLSESCDGANSHDGQGFNKADTSFGKWLADRISAQEPVIKSHAEAALKMLQKYSKQLAQGGLELPSWDLIAHQYPERIALPKATTEEGTEEKPSRRVEIKRGMVAVYAPYDATGKFQKIAKTIEGYSFNTFQDKGWTYPIKQLELVVEKFPESDGYVHDPNLEGTLELLKQQQLEEQEAKERELLEKSGAIVELIKAADLDSPLANGWHLRDYQKKGVEWLLAHRQDGIYRGGILADQMGLGKSLTALVAARAMQKIHDCPVLVIAPVSLLENWKREAERAQVAIGLWSWAKLPSPLENRPYVLIADEAHYMQSGEATVRGREAIALAQHPNCLAAWLLSGTPAKNGRPINLFPLLQAINHPFAEDKKDYEKRYCNGHYKDVTSRRTVWDNTGASHLDELAKKTEDAILRRTKDECLSELPAKTRLYETAELDRKQQTEYDQTVGLFVEDYRRRSQSKSFKRNLRLLFKTSSLKVWYSWVLAYNPVDESAEALVTLNILRKVGSIAKVPAAIELANDLLEQGQPVVIFTEFLESAKAISEALGEELLTGETEPERRQAIVDRFQSGESKVFVGTIKAGGVGLTLTAASNVILVDRAWTPGENLQAEDRTHRLGQKSAVFATWLQLGQVDLAIDSLVEEKQERIEVLLKGKTKTLENVHSAKDLAKELLAIL
jgi:SNF2 family DNA or RNA helicase